MGEVYTEGRAIRVAIAQAKRGPLLAASRSIDFESLPLDLRVEALVTASTPIDIHRALIDPDAVFASPWNVLAHPGLSIEQKRQILRRWEEDAAQVAVAMEEGMPGTESDLLRQILLALGQLSTREGPVLSAKTNGRRP